MIFSIPYHFSLVVSMKNIRSRIISTEYIIKYLKHSLLATWTVR